MPKGKTQAQRPVLVSADCEGWPYLPPELLRPSRSRQVCMTCHWFRHHAGASCITLLCCQLHQGLIGQGEHLSRRCHGARVPGVGVIPWGSQPRRSRG
jgi:hypothetical protein